jgi:hypothetical protein
MRMVRSDRVIGTATTSTDPSSIDPAAGGTNPQAGAGCALPQKIGMQNLPSTDWLVHAIMSVPVLLSQFHVKKGTYLTRVEGRLIEDVNRLTDPTLTYALCFSLSCTHVLSKEL